MEIQNKIERAKMSVEEHLLTRELVDFDLLTLDLINGVEPMGRGEITLNEDTLSKVATVWETNRQAITAVIVARIKPLLMQVALRDIPQEVTVTRQCILELIGVLEDFDLLHKESTKRNQKKEDNPL